MRWELVNNKCTCQLLGPNPKLFKWVIEVPLILGPQRSPSHNKTKRMATYYASLHDYRYMSKHRSRLLSPPAKAETTTNETPLYKA